MRASAEKGGSSLGGLSTGTQIEIIGSKNKDWLRVRAGGQEGYVYAPLVDTTGKMAANPESASSGSGSSRHHHGHHHGGLLVADASTGSSHTDSATSNSHSSSHHHHHSSHTVTASAPVEAPAMVP